MSPSETVFLAHFTGSGIDSILDMQMDDAFNYLDEALKLYELEAKAPQRVVLAGIEKR
ncbi:hypothetical protein AGMMS49965_23530 [Bacteroidia bacterium]|nr:hypothetical protein AGMMS49965_23530 [Bacteroidia bacterium]